MYHEIFICQEMVPVAFFDDDSFTFPVFGGNVWCVSIWGEKIRVLGHFILRLEYDLCMMCPFDEEWDAKGGNNNFGMFFWNLEYELSAMFLHLGGGIRVPGHSITSWGMTRLKYLPRKRYWHR